MTTLNSLPSSRQRLPSWFKVKIDHGENFTRVNSLMEKYRLHTVCKEAGCPNKWECWNRGTATIIILGEICTRGCRFCGVQKGRPDELDLKEVKMVAEAIKALGLKYAVITSVARDDLEDGGAVLFASVVEEAGRVSPDCRIELLIPDFKGSKEALYRVVDSSPAVLGHNLETVSRLYSIVRPQADYKQSLKVLENAKERDENLLIKSGLMTGFGESKEEIIQTMEDLLMVGCDILTIGQYLKPSRLHLPVEKFYTPEEFMELEDLGREMGFSHVKAGPLVRSSYLADEIYL